MLKERKERKNRIRERSMNRTKMMEETQTKIL
jgi:hypothetical protein